MSGKAHFVISFLQPWKKNRGEIYIIQEEEIDFIKNYIKVMNYRYGDVIQIGYDIEERLLSMPIPIFFIQPLVENALKHGFAATNCQGEIGIKIHKEGELVKIEELECFGTKVIITLPYEAKVDGEE